MPNQDLVNILKQGVAAWNQWRKETQSSLLDHRGIFLADSELRDLNLEGANLEYCYLAGAKLGGANLRGANLRGANLEKAQLISTDLSRADLSSAKLYEANFCHAKLEDANLDGAYAKGADFSCAQLGRANLFNALLEDTKFEFAFLNDAVLYKANLENANLSHAILNNSNLEIAKLYDADLRGTRLCNTNLKRAFLQEATLIGANCQGADFSGAILKMARLTEANLNGAILTGAELFGAQLTDWSIQGVVCEFAYWRDEGKLIKEFYKPGEFERLYGKKIKVRMHYKDGISSLEIATLPALIQHLATLYKDCNLRFQSIEDGPGGAVVTIAVDPLNEQTSEQTVELQKAIQSEAEQKAHYLRKALETIGENLLLKAEIKELNSQIDKLLSGIVSNSHELDGKPLALLVDVETHWSVLQGIVRQEGEALIFDDSWSGFPLVIQPEWIDHIKPVTEDLSDIITGADLFLRLSLGDLPEELIREIPFTRD
jgi:uncharacterized protein YjbI with pentapeptide repeats